MTYYDIAVSIVKKLQDQGFVAYFTGGWVRDYLMNHPSDDIDIATSANVEEILPLFEKTIPLGVQFGIVVAVIDEFQFEIATFRQEEDYKDGRRPSKISPASAFEDAQRRDFTINGLFYDPLKNEIIDYVEGQKDLKNRILRAIGNPHERFLEDRLRMIRAARYACRFHFEIEKETKEAIGLHAKDLFPSVAIERVWQEFTKANKNGNMRVFFILLFDLGLLKVIFNDLPSYTFQELKERLTPLDSFPTNAPLIAKISLLFPDYDLENKLKLCDQFKISNEEKSYIQYEESLKAQIFNENPSLVQLIFLYAHPSFDVAFQILISPLEKKGKEELHHHHEKKRTKYSKQIERIEKKKPLITSEILMENGVKPGRVMGNLLKEGQRISIEEHLDDVYSVMTLLKLSPNWPSNL